MEREEGYDYDDERDAFLVYSKKEGEETTGCMSIGDMDISISNNGRIIGIEISNFSKFLEFSNIDKDILKKIEKTYLKILAKKDSLFIGIELLLKNKEKSLVIPIGPIPYKKPKIHNIAF